MGENICIADFGKGDADRMEEDIKTIFPGGQVDENTLLGKEFGGTELSGGQWQRLAIARAFTRTRN